MVVVYENGTQAYFCAPEDERVMVAKVFKANGGRSPCDYTRHEVRCGSTTNGLFALYDNE